MTNTSVSQMITTCIVLPVDTLEGNWVEKKRQHSPSNTNLSIPFGERASLTLSTYSKNRDHLNIVTIPFHCGEKHTNSTG